MGKMLRKILSIWGFQWEIISKYWTIILALTNPIKVGCVSVYPPTLAVQGETRQGREVQQQEVQQQEVQQQQQQTNNDKPTTNNQMNNYIHIRSYGTCI